MNDESINGWSRKRIRAGETTVPVCRVALRHIGVSSIHNNPGHRRSCFEISRLCNRCCGRHLLTGAVTNFTAVRDTKARLQILRYKQEVQGRFRNTCTTLGPREARFHLWLIYDGVGSYTACLQDELGRIWKVSVMVLFR